MKRVPLRFPPDNTNSQPHRGPTRKVAPSGDLGGRWNRLHLGAGWSVISKYRQLSASRRRRSGVIQTWGRVLYENDVDVRGHAALVLLRAARFRPEILLPTPERVGCHAD